MLLGHCLDVVWMLVGWCLAAGAWMLVSGWCLDAGVWMLLGCCLDAAFMVLRCCWDAG